jgi:serine phosphatase RsbU (regulator of sigma subunit)
VANARDIPQRGPGLPRRYDLAPGWLSEVTARIGGSLDLRQTAAEVADAAVPGFADAAVIYAAERLLAGDDAAPAREGRGTVLRRLAARLSRDAADEASGLLPPGEVLFLGAGTAHARAMATGEPVVSAMPVPGAAGAAGPGVTVPAVPGRGARDVLARYRSFLVTPLIARSLTVGCAVFARLPDGAGFSAPDVALAGELASRAAVYIDNARLYDRERRTAQALQRGLLPGRLRVPPGIEVAHRYLPAGGNVIGGDWHDIVPLPRGRAALIVGDAMGHGPEAAAVMVQLRTAAHTLAALDLPPEQVLSRLDVMAADMDAAPAGATAPPFATCVYAVIDPAGGSGRVARAGHLPPLLVLPGGRAAELELPPGLPLGLGARPGSFRAARFTLAPGTAIALYTDGLVESRARPIDDGLAALRRELGAALAVPGVTAETACDAVIAALRGHGEDDITLLLARI